MGQTSNRSDSSEAMIPKWGSCILPILRGNQLCLQEGRLTIGFLYPGSAQNYLFLGGGGGAGSGVGVGETVLSN